MFHSLITRFFMPFTSGAGCVLGNCPPPAFPVTAPTCIAEVAAGGVNEVYFLPCTAVLNEVNVTNPTWWTGFVEAHTLGRSGLMLGSIGKKGTKTDRTGSCRPEQITGITWALKFVFKVIDKTSARTTQAKVNEVFLRFDKYLAVARMCDGDETVLPIGVFTATDLDWTVPDNFEENQSITLEISWKELGLPTSIDVPGLNAVLPKLS